MPVVWSTASHANQSSEFACPPPSPSVSRRVATVAEAPAPPGRPPTFDATKLSHDRCVATGGLLPAAQRVEPLPVRRSLHVTYTRPLFAPPERSTSTCGDVDARPPGWARIGQANGTGAPPVSSSVAIVLTAAPPD